MCRVIESERHPDKLKKSKWRDDPRIDDDDDDDEGKLCEWSREAPDVPAAGAETAAAASDPLAAPVANAKTSATR